MKEKTRYQYEKRIRELERQNDTMRFYRSVALNIYNNICDHVESNTNLNTHWLLRQFREVMK